MGAKILVTSMIVRNLGYFKSFQCRFAINASLL